MSLKDEINQLDTLLEHWTLKKYSDNNAQDLKKDIEMFREAVTDKFPNAARHYWNYGEYADTEFEDAEVHISHYLENGDQNRYNQARESVKRGLEFLIQKLKAQVE